MKLGIDAFAEALLGMPKILAENSGFDAQDAIIALQVSTAASSLFCRTRHSLTTLATLMWRQQTTATCFPHNNLLALPPSHQPALSWQLQ